METNLPTIREQNNKISVQGFCEGLELYHAVAFVCLAFNAVLAVYMSRDSPWDLVSIITGCASLIWQFWCLKRQMIMSQGVDAPPRWIWDVVKVVLWVMTIFLAVSFAARVSQTVPPLCLMIVVWSMSTYVTVAGICSSFLIFSKNVGGANKKSDSIVEEEKEHQSAHDLQLTPLEKV